MKLLMEFRRTVCHFFLGALAMGILTLWAASPELRAEDAGSAHSSEAWWSSLSETDRLAVSVQKICPVMGTKLGKMGTPIKVDVGGQHVFLCCKSCIGKQVDTAHWRAIQENIAAAQGTCPIMGKPVDVTMNSTVVEGQRIFVCCPPCIDKIERDVAANLKKVRENYVRYLANDAAARADQLQIAAQKICPVSGKPLGSMGEPLKIKVGPQETAFLCCQGCLSKKIDAGHWMTVQNNLAAAQGICPVMKKPVDSTMESTVVDGRRVFVCCPPCIDKINAKPATYVAKLNSQIEANLETADSTSIEQR